VLGEEARQHLTQGVGEVVDGSGRRRGAQAPLGSDVVRSDIGQLCEPVPQLGIRCPVSVRRVAELLESA
jgi:hypothetical protein